MFEKPGETCSPEKKHKDHAGTPVSLFGDLMNNFLGFDVAC